MVETKSKAQVPGRDGAHTRRARGPRGPLNPTTENALRLVSSRRRHPALSHPILSCPASVSYLLAF